MRSRRTRRASLFLVLIFLLAGFAMGQPGNLDSSFGVSGRVSTDLGGPSDAAQDVAIQPDGKIVAVGIARGATSQDFAITRYTRNGVLDPSFGGDGIVITPLQAASLDYAEAVVIQADGKILVGGYCTIDNQYFFAVVRYNANGTLDNTFNGTGIVLTFSNRVMGIHDMVLQPDGRIVLAGWALNVGTGEDFCLVRYNSNGSPDNGFGASGVVVAPINGNQVANGVALTSSNRIVVGGRSTGDGRDDFAIASFEPNGSFGTFRDWFVSTPIGLNTVDICQALAIQPDHKIVLVGTSEHSDGSRDTALVRYDPGNSLDTSFGSGGKVVRQVSGDIGGTDVKIQPNGRIVVGGYFRSSSSSRLYFTLQRFAPDGSLLQAGLVSWLVFPDIDCYSNALALQADGNIVLAGRTGNFAGITGNGFALMRIQGDSRERADFDGDRRSDLSIFRPLNGQWWIRNSGNGANAAVTFGAGTDRITPGDFDGDGKTDSAFWRPSTGEWFVLRSSNSSFYAVPFGTSGDIPAAADFDGDWKTDPAVFRPSTGTWYISKSTGGTSILQWGVNGDLPVPADYDGDARADVGIFRPSDGSWWINRSIAGVFVTAFGNGADRAVPADYTGDGKTDVAFWRPSNGAWYVLRSEDSSYFSVPFGTSGDLPAPGEYDGDTKSDLAVFRPSNATWYISGSRGGTVIQQFGSAGDIPVSRGYIP